MVFEKSIDREVEMHWTERSIEDQLCKVTTDFIAQIEELIEVD